MIKNDNDYLHSYKFDISVIIVNYNVKDFLYKCLKSIELAKKNLKVEIIIVDNNSTDGSYDFISSKFPEIQYISNSSNLGFSKANNIGFKFAQGKYYLILNPDTLISEDTLELMYQYMENNTNVGISGCKVLNPDGSFQMQCRRGFPTPFASFSKLFGLQSLFPNSKIFAQYNQTFRSIDETYYIDAVIGAFMFARADVIDMVGGFDEDYFMYGEDIDLCFNVKQAGFEIAYFHNTKIIHYKGESTKRSNINDVKHFYSAMQIFAKKHYGNSHLFLLLLKSGIFLREIIAYFIKYKREFQIIIADIILLDLSLLIATMIRFGDFFAFPDYAYPVVFIWINSIVTSVMILVGEYFESRHTVRRFMFGMLISFFIISVLMYFFQNFAFSRGVLLVMIGLSILFSATLRFFILLFEKLVGKDADKRIIFIGDNKYSKEIIDNLSSQQSKNLLFLGIVKSEFDNSENIINLPFLGNLNKLNKIISENDIDEVIITEPNISHNDLISILQNNTENKTRFHLVNHIEDLMTSRILNDISGEISLIPKYNINILRYRIFKRLFDLVTSFLILVCSFPLLLSNKSRVRFLNLFEVLIGQKSIVGTFPIEGKEIFFKEGITGLVHISKPERLSNKMKEDLNEYYVTNYSFSLDLDILLKLIFRK